MTAKNREAHVSSDGHISSDGYVPSDEALRLQRQRERLGQLLAELELEYGPIPPEIEAEVEAAWPR